MVDKCIGIVYIVAEVIDMNNSKTSSMHIRVNPETRRKAMAVLDEIGISASELFNMLLNQVAIQNRIPFDLVTTKYICAYGYLHDYSKIQSPDDDEYTEFDNFDDMKEWLDA